VKRFHDRSPHGRVDDILVHPRDNDLIVATHGRSFYILDDITCSSSSTRRALAGTRSVQRGRLCSGEPISRSAA
jgi:hypothetical protein